MSELSKEARAAFQAMKGAGMSVNREAPVGGGDAAMATEVAAIGAALRRALPVGTEVAHDISLDGGVRFEVKLPPSSGTERCPVLAAIFTGDEIRALEGSTDAGVFVVWYRMRTAARTFLDAHGIAWPASWPWDVLA